MLALAYMNSHFQTGLKNVLDRAVLAHDGDPRARRDPRLRQGRRDPLRLPAPHHVGRRPHARGQGPHHLARAPPRRSSHAARTSSSTAQLYPMDHAAHRGAEEGVRAALSADGFRVLAIASKDVAPRGIVAGDATPYSKADECDLILERLRRLPRSAEGDRRGGDQGPAGPRRRGQGRHRRQRPGRPQDLQGGRAVHRVRAARRARSRR